MANQPTKTDCVNLHEEHIWYYDGLAIFHQIAQYTKDKRWLDVCAKCRSYYRDSYAIGCKKYSVDGWRNFTRGLYYDWAELKDEVSKNTASRSPRRASSRRSSTRRMSADGTKRRCEQGGGL